VAEMGRPKVFTPELVDKFIAGIATGIPLRQLCRENDVGKSAWYELMQRDPELSGRFAQARVEGFDEIAEECMEIADDGSRDYIPNEEGGAIVDHDHIQRSKLRIETRLKLLAKWDPKRYGDKMALVGKDDGPVQFQIESLTDDQLQAEAKALLALLPKG
jgi:hypothetical protein